MVDSIYLRQEVLLSKPKQNTYPYYKKDSEGNTWCILANDVAIYLNDIYDGRTIPDVKTFVTEYKELCDNAINGSKYMKRLEREKSKLKTQIKIKRRINDE